MPKFKILIAFGYIYNLYCSVSFDLDNSRIRKRMLNYNRRHFGFMVVSQKQSCCNRFHTVKVSFFPYFVISFRFFAIKKTAGFLITYGRFNIIKFYIIIFGLSSHEVCSPSIDIYSSSLCCKFLKSCKIKKADNFIILSAYMLIFLFSRVRILSVSPKRHLASTNRNARKTAFGYEKTPNSSGFSGKASFLSSYYGAGGGGRTRMILLSLDFESSASANSTTPA